MVCAHGHTKGVLKHYSLWMEFLDDAFIVHLDCIKYNEINIHFHHAGKLVTNRIKHELHSTTYLHGHTHIHK